MIVQLLVTHLNPLAHADALTRLFAAHGQVLAVRLLYSTDPSARLAALVDMADEPAARAATAALDGWSFLGTCLHVAFAAANAECPAGALPPTLYWSPAARHEVESRSHSGPKPGTYGDRGGSSDAHHRATRFHIPGGDGPRPS